MALLRLMKRRINCIALFLLATTFWIFYLILSAPAASDKRYTNGVLPHNGDFRLSKESVTRRVVAAPLQPANNDIGRKPDEVVHVLQPPQPPAVDAQVPANNTEQKQAIPRPPQDLGVDPVNSQDNKNEIEKIEDKDDSKLKVKNDILKSDTKDIKEELKSKDKPVEVSKETVAVVNETKKYENETKPPVLKKMQNKVIEIGNNIKNKTIGDWENVKNKTLAKLTDLGVIKKPTYVKFIYSQVKWNLNLSIEDIGNIMKDTEFLKRKQNITEMEYQPLMAPNSSVNVSDVKYGLGYCDCKDLSCLCCVRVFNKWMRLNSTTCSTITFSSKSQELQFEFVVDKKPVFSRTIAAEFPPKICLESQSKVAGTCVLFSNVTAKVNPENAVHKIHLSGCMEFDLTLYNKTVSAFPVGCFKIPGANAKEHESDNAPNFGNFMP